MSLHIFTGFAIDFHGDIFSKGREHCTPESLAFAMFMKKATLAYECEEISINIAGGPSKSALVRILA